MFNPSFYVILFLGFLGFSQTEEYTVFNIGLNDEKPHFGLSFNKGGDVLFTSYAVNKNGRVKRLDSGEGVLSLYSAKKAGDGEIINVEPLHIDEDEGSLNVTGAAYSPDNKHLFVTTTYNDRENRPKGNFNETNFHIEIAEFKEGIGWTDFKVLPFCDPKYSYGHPVVSADGKTLYFIANIRGGKQTTKGESDIFKVDILANSTFGKPINLGPNVNSYSKEMFPFIGLDNTLYFASNRPGGLGGFDLYKCPVGPNGVFRKAEKMPSPLNSDKDDFCLVMGDGNKSGYFTSKRDGGKGDDDIYYFRAK